MNNVRRFCNERVVPRVRGWFNPTSFDPKKLRALLLGKIVTIIIAEVCAYKLIKQNIIAGELNIFTTDFVIIGISLLEAIVGPFVAWYGFRNRRLLLVFWSSTFALVCLLWLAMPSMTDRNESEYCHAYNFMFRGITVTPKAAVRLSLLVASCVVFCLARVAVWCHGIAFIDDHAPARTGMHFGILVIVRVLPLLAGDKILTAGAEKSLNMQVFALVGSTIGSIVQAFLFVPKKLPSVDEDSPLSNRGFFASLNRVVQNTAAVAQMVAIGLLAAALWGFAFNESEIAKVIYHIDPRDSSVDNIKQVLQYFVVIISVLYVGVKFSAPILSTFCRFRGIKQATIMSILTLVFYIVLVTVGQCERGQVAGLDANRYSTPNCSVPCNCIPRWREFSPVCDLNSVTTYLSPCQAGCSSSEVVNDIRVYTNCSCVAGSGRVAIGGCGQGSCYLSYQLHLTFFIMLITVTVLAFQAHGLILLRVLDPRDKSVGLGMLCSVVSVITFVCGHLIFMGINAATCRWFEAARCHLQSQNFPIFVGSTSAAMVLLSITISITTWVSWRLAEKKSKDEDLASPEERILMDR